MRFSRTYKTLDEEKEEEKNEKKSERKKSVRKNRRASVVVAVGFSVISNFSCQFSLCATKEEKRKNDSVDRWMDGKMHGRRRPTPPA